MRYAVFFTLLLTAVAYAHDTEQWIADKELHDPVTKYFCCGPLDCSALEDGAVKEVEGGFQVHVKSNARMGDVVDEMIPYQRAMPFSPDGHYHACISWDNETGKPNIRCFIIPPGLG